LLEKFFTLCGEAGQATGIIKAAELTAFQKALGFIILSK